MKHRGLMNTHDAFEMGVLFGTILQRLRDVEAILADIPREDRCDQVEIAADNVDYLLQLMVDEYEKSEGT